MKPKVKRCNLKGNKYDGGGQVMSKESYNVGDRIKYIDPYKQEEKEGVIYEISETGNYIVNFGSGFTSGVRAVNPKEVVGAYPKVEAKKKRFGFFDNGGEMGGDESGSRKNRYTDYYLIVDLDERGEYQASVYNPEEKLVFRIHSIEEMNDLIESGYLKAQADEDLDGLTQYLMEMEIIPNYSQVYSEDEYLSEIQPKYEEDEDEYETNDECVEAVVDMARGVKEVADFFIVEGKLIIVFKTQLTTNEMDELNSELKGIKGCGEVFEDSFELGVGEGYKTIILELKTDDVEIGKFAKGGSIAEGNYHMILSQAKEVKHHVDELQKILKKEDSIEAWVVAKMENVSSTLSDITHYLDGKSEMPKAKRGMKVGKKSKGDIGKSGTQYGYTLEEWEEMAKDNGLLVSPKEWWKSQQGMSYTDSFGRKKKIGQHSQDERQSMQSYGYRIAIGLDLGSKIIPASAKKYVEENDYMKYAEGGETPMAKDGMKVDKIEYPSISLKEKDLNDDQAEIYGFIENHQPLNRQMDAIRKNLMTKIARGQFDEKKAPKIFIYLIDNGLKSYEKLHGNIELSKKEKEEMANNMVIDFMSEAEQGNYENETFLPKKYLAEDGMFIMSYDVYDEDGDAIILMGSEQDLIDFANTMWYYDMLDEDGEEIDDFDVAKDYLEQYDYQIKSNSPKSATNKKKVRRASVK